MKKTVSQLAGVKKPPTIFPPPLKEGDTIGLVAPAGPLIETDNYSAGIRVLEKQGFKVKYSRQLLCNSGYLAGSDQERAADFNRLWADPGIKAIMAARGGYGCLRLLDLIDMDLIGKTPKLLIGFSDITVLLTAIPQKTGLVTYHGPVITTLAGIDKNSLVSFFNTLHGNSSSGITQPAGLQVLKDGKAKGILYGGNLTTLVHMLATPYEIPWHETILFLEDVGEPPYRLDRFLTHLSAAQRLTRIKGLILGTFSSNDRQENGAMQGAVQQRITELLKGYDIPVLANFPVGHSRRNLTLPIGAAAAIDTSDGSLRFSV